MDAAVVEGEIRVRESEVDWVADQVIDQECVAADPQALPHELHDLVRRQVVNEQFTADEIEARIAERQGQRVSGNGARAVTNVRGGAIEQREVEMNVVWPEPLTHGVRNVAGAGGHVEPRKPRGLC